MSFPLPAARPWLARRLFPVLATAGLVAVGMAATTWWGPGLLGKHSWMLPHDLLRTLVAARRLAHLDLGGLYTPPTGLISLPGAAVILVPLAAVISAAGLTLRIPGPGDLHPGAWLLAGPYLVVVSALAPPSRRRRSPLSPRPPGPARGSGGRRWWEAWASPSSSPGSRCAPAATRLISRS